MATYRGRQYVEDHIGIGSSIPSLVYASMKRLGGVFQDVAGFGGAPRTAAMNIIRGGTYTYDDIDIRVANPINMPIELASAFSGSASPSLNAPFVQPSEAVQDIFFSWSGLNLTAFNNTPRGIKIQATHPDQPDKKLDIGLRHTMSVDVAKLPFAVATITDAPSPFSSVGVGKDGTVWTHAHTCHDIAEMEFEIHRDLGVIGGLRNIGYFRRMQEKYPEIILVNNRVGALAIVKQVRDWARDHHFLPSAHRETQLSFK